MDNEV